MVDGIELPRLYIAENPKDVDIAKSRGIPFVRWNRGQEALIKMLLRPVLEKMFPHINWDKVLGYRKQFITKVEICEARNDDTQLEMSKESYDDSEYIDDAHDMTDVYEDEEAITEEHVIGNDCIIEEVADISDGERLFSGGIDMMYIRRLDIEDYIGDMSSYVNIEMLQRLRLMPAFIGDILDCIKLNMTSGIYWSEGYNKKLGLPVGRFDSARQLPNLIILDVSGSIPRGISATMISLVDTLRSQLSADLIITGSNSRFYPMGEKLPDPQAIRNMFGFGNEARDFFKILSNNIEGKKYGHVFSFGDDDCPEYFNNSRMNMPVLVGTSVECVHHYHTWAERSTGYAKWCEMLGGGTRCEYDCDWCNIIYRKV